MGFETEFAPAERASEEQVAIDYVSIRGNAFAVDWADHIPQMLVLINGQRQIVYANRLFQDFVDQEKDSGDLPSYVGRRPGEAIGCIHARQGAGGCGTSRFCRTCGAIKTILAAQRENRRVEDECRIIRQTRSGEEALDLRVTSVPVAVDRKPFQLFTLTDISDEKRRKVLERIFFHDILNTAGAVRGIAALLQEADFSDLQSREMVELLNQSSAELVEEIQAQRSLAAAERGDLTVSPGIVETLPFLERRVQTFAIRAQSEGKQVLVDRHAVNLVMETDPSLLGRVLHNLIKNALEASSAGQRVTTGCTNLGEHVAFWVHNQTAMEMDVQLQVFKRSFSTKGTGRGLGTHSVKLLTERYLKGRVAFGSTPDSGTEFCVTYPIYWPEPLPQNG